MFQKIVEASGLSRLFAEGLVANCCRKVGVAPGAITAENLPKILDEVEKAVRMFKPGDADRVMSAMRAIR